MSVLCVFTLYATYAVDLRAFKPDVVVPGEARSGAVAADGVRLWAGGRSDADEGTDVFHDAESAPADFTPTDSA